MNLKKIITQFYKPSNVRFWIILFFILRLYGITQPPLEVAHNWRQTTVTMVARNFHEVNSNIFYPRIDVAGEKTGITGMEFPIFNYLIYLVSLILNYQHWYGRLLNLIITSIGIFYFYRLVKKYFSEKTSIYSSIILIVSIWFIYARKIMPDTFSISLIIAGLYYGTNFFEENKNKKNIILYFIFISIGILSKLTSGYLLVLFIPILIKFRQNWYKTFAFCLVSLLAIFLSGVWYFYWVPMLVETYGTWYFFMGKDLITGFKEIISNWNLTLTQFYSNALHFIGFAVFFSALIYAFIKRKSKIILIFCLTFFSFLIIIFKSGFTFYHHSYYIIPFAPVMALIAGFGLSVLKHEKLARIILILICIEGVLNSFHDFSIKKKDLALVSLETDLDNFSSKNELILINSNEYPTPMYIAHRKGWVSTNNKIADPEFIKQLSNKGLKHIVILKQTFGTDLELPYKKEFENSYYTIYSSLYGKP